MARHDAIPVIMAAHRAAFSWGEHDCATFAMDVVEAVTGKAPYALRGTYSTQVGAALQLKAHGFDSIEEALVAAFPVENDPPRRGRLGDIGIANGPDGPVCVINDGDPHSWIARGETGVVRLEASFVLRSFKVI